MVFGSNMWEVAGKWTELHEELHNLYFAKYCYGYPVKENRWV